MTYGSGTYAGSFFLNADGASSSSSWTTSIGVDDFAASASSAASRSALRRSRS
jgi:hypothetical protein